MRQDMTERLPGEYPPFITRPEAEEQVDKIKRYLQITEVLRDCGALTAKEAAVELQKRGYIPTSERNFTAPRLTEMTQRGIVEPVGRTTCRWTGRPVAVYALCKKEEQDERD